MPLNPAERKIAKAMKRKKKRDRKRARKESPEMERRRLQSEAAKRREPPNVNAALFAAARLEAKALAEASLIEFRRRRI